MSVTVCVKMLTGKTLTFIFTEQHFKSTTALQLKTKIRERAGISETQQRLVFAGQQLEDQRLLSGYGVEHESSIHLIILLWGRNQKMGKLYQVVVHGLRGEKMMIDLCNTEEQLQSMTVRQLKEKIMERLPENSEISNLRLVVEDRLMDDDGDLLSAYGIHHMSLIYMILKVPGGVTQTQRRHDDPNNQKATCSLNSVLKDPEMHDRGRTTEEHASVNVKEQPKDSCEQRLDDKTKTEKEEQRAFECPEKILHQVSSTEASEVFRGQLRVTTKCSNCHTVNKETFWFLLSGKDSHDTTYSESSARKLITEHKVELIDYLMADHSYILQHAHAKQIITDRQYQDIKEKSHSTPRETVTDLIDYVILNNGPESWTAFLEVLKLPEVLSTYPQLKEIVNKMLRSKSGHHE